MIYRPPRGLGFIIGLFLTIWASAATLFLVSRVVAGGIDFEAFLLGLATLFFGVLALLFMYWSFACLSTTYIVDRNGLAIQWGAIRQLIPLAEIQRLVPGTNVKKPRIEGLGWWGHHIGKGQIRGLGTTLFYSTHRTRRELLYVVTADRAYGICVHDPVLFAREIQNRQLMGPTRAMKQVPIRNAFANQNFWGDRWVQALLFVGFAACAGLYGYVSWVYPGLPRMVDIEFPSLGGLTRVASRDEILKIPTAALVILVVDVALAFVAHSWQRLLSYLLLLGGISTQAVLAVAAVVALN
ncbi:MAG: hypothetical protein GEU28_04515 [Dehalococcoidia bacterium]|nr:hypothetical protein [Dehalococcoidia bacterium]